MLTFNNNWDPPSSTDAQPRSAVAAAQTLSGYSLTYMKIMATVSTTRTPSTGSISRTLIAAASFARCVTDSISRQPTSIRPHAIRFRPSTLMAFIAGCTDHCHRSLAIAIGLLLVTVLRTGCKTNITATRPPPPSMTVPTAWNTDAVPVSTTRHQTTAGRHRLLLAVILITYR